MEKKCTKVTSLSIFVISCVVSSCAVLPAYTPKIKSQNSVSSLEKIELGGVKQSILIRGENKSAPILLFLHGGPGMPLMYLSHTFQRELEKEFTVVQWDRRGAGKSYSKHIDTLTITDEQYYKDAFQLIQLLKSRFKQPKIFLVGHSWGTYLGSLLAHKNPELFYAYISVGQIVNSDKAQLLQEVFIKSKAKELNRNDALSDLEKFGVGAYEKWLFKFGGEVHADTSYRLFVKAGMKSPEYSLRDAFKISKGSKFCSKYIQYKLVKSTIEKEIQSYTIPCFFIVGKYDMTTPASLIEEYFGTISSPDKKIFWFNHSAHFPFYEERSEFFKTMIEIKNQVLTQHKK